MSKVSFKVVSNYPGVEPKRIEMSSVSRRTGNVYFLDEYGKRFDRPQHSGEKASSIVLDSVETFDYQGEQKKRVFALVEYEVGLVTPNPEKQLANNVKQAQHSFLKEHNLIKIKDENGNNVNPNAGTMVAYELIEESEVVKRQVEINSKIADYQAIAKKMFTETQKTFVNFCYAYGIQNVENTPIEVLFNEVIHKINLNPDYFNEIYTHKNRRFLTLFNKALETTIDEEQLINVENDFYYFEGNVIGTNAEEAMFWFDKHPKKKEILELKLGEEPETDIEVVKLPATGVTLEPSERESTFRAKVDIGRMSIMKSEVVRMVNKFASETNKATKEGKSVKEAEDTFKQKRDELRDKYKDIEAAFDTFLEEKLKSKD